MNLSQSLQDVLTQFLLVLPNLIFALVTFLVTLALSGFLDRIITRTLQRRKVSPQIVQLLSQITRWSVLIIGTVIALQQVNFNLTSFVAGLGILGFTAGFALQEVTQNFVAGILLLIEQPFESGDYVQIVEYEGHVKGIDLRATRITTLDGEDVLIPNSIVFSNAVMNYTLTPSRRFKVVVGVTYGSDLDVVEQVALEAIARVPMVLQDPAPFVGFHTFNDSSIDLSVYYWVDGRTVLPPQAHHGAVTAIKKAFDKAGITIPFPIRTVYMAAGK